MHRGKEFATCEHDDTFGGRQEYCVSEAQDIEGYVSIAVEALDRFAYPEARSDGFSLSVDSQEQRTERQITFIRGETDGWVWPLTEASLQAIHTINKSSGLESYLFTAGWAVQQSGISDTPYVSKYYFEVNPNVSVEAWVEEFDFAENRRLMRPMTDYDFGELVSQLEECQRYLAATANEEARTALAP